MGIRARLAVAFAAALLLVLVLAGTFVYVRVEGELTGTIDDRLETQAAELAAIVAEGGPGDGELPEPADPEDGFSQVLTPGGEVVLSTGAPGSGGALNPAELREVADRARFFEQPVTGVDGEARMLAATVPGTERIVVAGLTTEDREETLAGIAGAFAIGAPMAVLLATGLGYLLAARAMGPVEAMRRRAGEITLERSGERLPLPAADDEIRRLGETLNEMLDRIETSLERERVFVADASHELRTPLAVLRSELELAARPGRSPEDLRAAIRSAAEETERLTRLAEDLLVIARSDQGRLPIKREQVPVEEMLARVRDRFDARATEGGRRIAVEAAPALRADVDPLRIEQALGNLVDNALRHGRGEVRLSGRLADGSVVLDVGDGGPGFPEGFESEAFERFTRADEGRTGGGAGLGLAIVRAIATAHGGRVAIESGDGGGATVRLELPSEERGVHQ